MQPISVFEVQACIAPDGTTPFTAWFGSLDGSIGRRVAATLVRMAAGNLGDAKSVGEGVSESRLDLGPGYRIYFGRDGERLILLLGGGTKRRQAKDIASAKQLWKIYKEEKRKGLNP